MKWLAICLNVLLVVTVFYLFATDGAPHGGFIFLFVLMLGAPIFSIVALLLSGSESWIGLYLKRKSLEEKRKIDNLGGK